MTSSQGRKRFIALLNPNTSAATTARMVEIAQAVSTPAFEIVGLTAPFGAPLITDPNALATARQAVLSLPRETFAGFDGVIVAAFGDPGADELSRRLDVPVIGIAAASMQAAATFGRFSVVTTTPLLAASIRSRATALGLGEALVSVRTTPGDPAALMSDPDRLRDALAVLIDEAVAEDGAAAVIIGGGPLAVVARALAQTAPVPLIEPVPVATEAIIARLLQT
jgi:Asp/Glu/hydantoin racemase